MIIKLFCKGMKQLLGQQVIRNWDDGSFRVYEILAFSATHIYLKNIKTGYRFNENLDRFNRLYKRTKM